MGVRYGGGWRGVGGYWVEHLAHPLVIHCQPTLNQFHIRRHFRAEQVDHTDVGWRGPGIHVRLLAAWQVAIKAAEGTSEFRFPPLIQGGTRGVQRGGEAKHDHLIWERPSRGVSDCYQQFNTNIDLDLRSRGAEEVVTIWPFPDFLP